MLLSRVFFSTSKEKEASDEGKCSVAVTNTRPIGVS